MLGSILAHHQEPADPDLLEWLRHEIDALSNLGPLALVIPIGALAVAIPMAILVVYALHRRHARS